MRPALFLLLAVALLIGIGYTVSSAQNATPAAPAPPSSHAYIIKVGDCYVNADHITHIYPWTAGADHHHVLRVEFDTAISTEIDAQDFTGDEEATLRRALDAIAH